MANFIKFLFGKNTGSKRILPKVETLKIVVVEFVEYGNYGFGLAMTRLLQKNPSFNVRYFDEPFNKSFLNLQGRNFFDLVDAGNMILQKLNADVIVWGYQENENIRLNFQTANAYSDWDNVSSSILESLFVPAEYFEHINFFPEMLTNLITGIIAASISEQRIDLRHLKQKLLKGVINNFNNDGPSENGSLMYSPYVMNTVGLIYLSFSQKELSQKTFNTAKELFMNALSYKNQIMQNVHLGCIYKNLAQLYELALKQDLGGYWLLFREAITNYRTAQRYLDHYNYPYDFALISFKLSQLYFQYWKFSNDISMLAIRSYKNKQQVYRKELYPVMWAKIQENIANVYYNIGKNSRDKKAFAEAIDYYQSALKIYENKKLQQEISIVNSSMDKVMKAWRA